MQALVWPVNFTNFFFTDIGYGNYLLTAPVERNKRQFWKAESEIPVEMEKIDVSDLLSLANTLTNPLAPAKKKKDKTELWAEESKRKMQLSSLCFH